MSYSVFLVDDEELVLKRLTRGFDWEDTGFEVLATFQSSENALEEIGLLKPDLVISDIKMPRLSGLELMEQCASRSPNTRFIFISGHEEFSYVHKAIGLGAVGYCLKPLDDDELIEGLNKVKDRIDDRHMLMQHLLGDVIDFESKNSALQLYEKFTTCGVCADYIAVALGDIEDELKGFVGYHKLRYDTNTYLYLLEDANHIKTVGFSKRLHLMLSNGDLEGFKYCHMPSEEDFTSCVRNLINAVHTRFLCISQEPQEFYHDPSDKVVGTYLATLEKDYVNKKITDLVQHIDNYKTLYADSERNIFEVITIYNIVMSIIFVKSKCFFADDILKLTDVTSQFHDVNEMMEMLQKVARHTLLRSSGVDETQVKNNTLQNIIKYINSEFKNPINFNSICIMFAVSPSYLSQMFQKELGVTFTAYVTQLRINYAKELLENSSTPISDVAELCGYTQFCYFSKLFKKQTDMSPSEYRKSKKDSYFKV